MGGLQRGRGRRGFNNIYTLNIVPYHQKCFLFVCSSYRGLKKNIISCQRVSNACTAWWFLLRNILVIFCCVQDSVHGLLNENGNIPRPLSPEGVVWVSETSYLLLFVVCHGVLYESEESSDELIGYVESHLTFSKRDENS